MNTQDTQTLAAQAGRELALTNAAFDTIRKNALELAVSQSGNKEAALEAICYARVIDLVRQKLNGYLDSARIEEAVQNSEES